MQSIRSVVLLTALIVAPFVADDALAQITRIDFEVVESPVFDGRNFGEVGQYERVPGSRPWGDRPERSRDIATSSTSNGLS